MELIDGKILVFTDLHLGIKSGSKSRLAICINAIKEMLQYIKKNKVLSILFLGDWHHVRVSTENNVLNVSYKLMSTLAKHCKVYCLLGNHDIYMKNSSDINSMVMFKDIDNVNIVDSVEEVSINGNKSLLVPWLGDVSKYDNEIFDMMFGHFDVSSKYLIKSYIEDNSNKVTANKTVSDSIDADNLLEVKKENTASDYIGDFVDVVKREGSVFSGHIHCHKEFIAKGRKFVFVGDPYLQNLGEKEYDCGFYVIDEDNSYKFHQITSVPKHVDVFMSKVVNDIDNFDFSIIKGNLVHKIYDVEVDNVTDAKIAQKINDWQPYEELLPDYEVDLNCSNEIKLQNASIELIKKSKLEYVKSYIDNIDKNVLKEQDLDPDKLYKTLADYYNNITDEK